MAPVLRASDAETFPGSPRSPCSAVQPLWLGVTESLAQASCLLIPTPPATWLGCYSSFPVWLALYYRPSSPKKIGKIIQLWVNHRKIPQKPSKITKMMQLITQVMSETNHEASPEVLEPRKVITDHWVPITRRPLRDKTPHSVRF